MSASTDLKKGLIGVTDVPSLSFYMVVFLFFALSVYHPGNGRGQTTAPATAATTGDVVLLDFSADWCGPCKQMAPLIGEIGAAGWLVRHVDVDQEHDIVKRFEVTGVPCYILLVKGHEVGRINGATTRGEFEKLLAKSRQPLGLQELTSQTDFTNCQTNPRGSSSRK